MVRPPPLVRVVLVLGLLVLPLALPMAEAAAPLSLARAGGGVVFTFSNGYASATTAAGILEANGMRGTFYVSNGLLRQGAYYTDYVSAAEVTDLAQRGHDIGSMTVSQRDLTTLPADDRDAELALSQDAIRLLTGTPVLQLAYPYGAVNDGVAGAAAVRYSSGRALTSSVSSFTTSVDAYHLPGLIVSSATSLATAKSYIDYAKSHDVVVVLAFERIVTSPGTYDWTPSDLSALAAYAKAEGVWVPTVAQLAAGNAPTPPPPPAERGRIVFTFDDGTTFQIASAQKLAERGMRGTFYIVSDCAKGETTDCMSESQVQALADAGHDVQAHTERHRDLTKLSGKRLTTELAGAQRELESLVDRSVRHVAYPYGSHNAAVRAETAKYYSTGRIYLTNPAPWNLDNLLAQSGNDRYLLPGIGIVQATSLATAKAYVDYAYSRDVTLVLALHDVRASGGDAYSWRPADYDALVDYVASSGVRVQTMRQAYG